MPTGTAYIFEENDTVAASGAVFVLSGPPAGGTAVIQTRQAVVPITVTTVVTPAIEALLFGPSGTVYRRADIFESDGATPWLIDAPLIDGSVTVDSSREERRAFDLTFDNEDGDLSSDPDSFWYDKVIKLYRGVEGGGIRYEALLGTFNIDRIAAAHFPGVVKVTGRDYSKRLMQKFGVAIAFAAGIKVEDAIRGILVSGGITDYNLPITGKTLDRDFAYDKDATRMQAIKEIATAFNYEVFFTVGGEFTMQVATDPSSSNKAFTFTTGLAASTLTSYNKSTNDSRVFNVVTVTGQTATRAPIAYTAENNNPSSPTSTQRLGRRVWPYDSALVQTQQQCQELAESFLRVLSLESYEVSMESLVVPWLDAGTTVEFIDPDATPGSPTSFLMTDFTIPLTLGSMSANARRVTIVG